MLRALDGRNRVLGCAARGASAGVERIANELAMGLGAAEGRARSVRARRGMIVERCLEVAVVLMRWFEDWVRTRRRREKSGGDGALHLVRFLLVCDRQKALCKSPARGPTDTDSRTNETLLLDGRCERKRRFK